MAMNLFEMTMAQKDVLAQIEDGLLTAEQAFDTLEAIEEALEEKYDGYAAIDFSLKSDEEALAAEIKRLTARKTSIANERKRLRERVVSSLEALDMKRIKTNRFTISRAVRKTYVITDESKIPDEFRERKFVETINAAEVKARLKDGEQIDGAEVQEATSLTIR